MDILVGPVHLGDVYQTFHPILNFDKTAVIGDVGHFTEQAFTFGIATGDISPGIITGLF